MSSIWREPKENSRNRIGISSCKFHSRHSPACHAVTEEKSSGQRSSHRSRWSAILSLVQAPKTLTAGLIERLLVLGRRHAPADLCILPTCDFTCRIVLGNQVDGSCGRQLLCNPVHDLARAGNISRHDQMTNEQSVLRQTVLVEHRSEERRVGKECRSRWS